MRSSRRPEKSGAKTFAPLGRCCFSATGPKEQSFFATFCSQKVAFLSSLKHNWFGLIML
jgi:hypothetical protein